MHKKKEKERNKLQELEAQKVARTDRQTNRPQTGLVGTKGWKVQFYGHLILIVWRLQRGGAARPCIPAARGRNGKNGGVGWCWK